MFPQPAEIRTHSVKIGLESSADMPKTQSSCVVNEAQSFECSGQSKAVGKWEDPGSWLLGLQPICLLSKTLERDKYLGE